MFKRFRGIKKLQKYLDKDINDILNEEELESKPRILHCVICQVHDENMIEIKSLLEYSTRQIMNNGGYISKIMSSIIFSYFGFNEDEIIDISKIDSVIENLIIKKVKVIYHKTIGEVTNLGTEDSYSYGPVILNFNNIISEFNSMEYHSFKKL